MHDVKNAIDTLTEDFQSFKAEQRAQLDTLRTKSERALLQKARPLVASQEAPSSASYSPEFQGFLTKGTALTTKSLTSSADDRGGFLIPQVIHDRILDQIEINSPIRSLARSLTISTGAVDVLLNKSEPDVGWVAEDDARPETRTPEVAKIKIPVHELYASPRATQKLLDDAAVHVENWLIQKVAERMAQMETNAFIHGDGDRKPRGFLTYELVTKDALEWGKIEKINTGVTGGFEEENGGDILIDVLQSMKSMYLKDAVWLMSRSALAAVRKLKDQTTGQYLWQPGLGSNTPSSLLGHPVVVCDEMPSVTPGTASNGIVFANLKAAYQIVDRQGIQILRDPFTAKPQVEFYVTKRVGGDVINFDAIKVLSFEETA